MALNNENLETIKSLNYIPVGLKNNNFSNEWLRDNTKENISKKNSYYGEYTFYYWYWKNLLKFKDDNEWVGFCSYREYWGSKKNNKSNNINDLVLREYQPEWSNYEAIIGEPISIGSTKLMKVLKYGKSALIRNPKAIFFKNARTIRWQFDMFHGNGNLDKAIDLLPNKDREDFRNFTRNSYSYNQGNMFITKSKSIMQKYYKEVFDWLEKCENVFGFDLQGYGKTRIYGFLAERFMSYWFQKNSNYTTLPIVHFDIGNK